MKARPILFDEINQDNLEEMKKKMIKRETKIREIAVKALKARVSGEVLKEIARNIESMGLEEVRKAVASDFSIDSNFQEAVKKEVLGHIKKNKGKIGLYKRLDENSKPVDLVEVLEIEKDYDSEILIKSIDEMITICKYAIKNNLSVTAWNG